jgi:hypothetical protein
MAAERCLLNSAPRCSLQVATAARGGRAHAGEASVNPERFMAAMRQKGLEAFADLAMTKPFP